MKFSPQQQEAFRLIESWFDSDRGRPFILNGYAGTGKSTIAKFMPAQLDINPSEVIYCSFTGKAALQLRRKGCEDATTIHKLLYMPVDKSRKKLVEMEENLAQFLVADPDRDDEEVRKLRGSIAHERKRISEVSFAKEPDWERIRASKLIVVDESSMINSEIAEDLMSVGLPIIYCGDPFQLPPVKGESPVSRMSVDMMLTEVHRQALENPILSLATDLRNGKALPNQEQISGTGDDVLEFVRLKNATYEMYAGHDQIICAKNATRYRLNKKMRQKRIELGEIEDNGLGISPGERGIFLNNDNDEGIFNGTIAKITAIKPMNMAKNRLLVSGDLDDGSFEDYAVYDGWLRSEKRPDDAPRGQAIDLAYGITCHKSQGSEWDSVLVHYETLYGSDMARWAYTALTRARKRCTVVIPNSW